MTKKLFPAGRVILRKEGSLAIAYYLAEENLPESEWRTMATCAIPMIEDPKALDLFRQFMQEGINSILKRITGDNEIEPLWQDNTKKKIN